MITKSGFIFKLKSNPRTKDGGFGPERCTICKSNTTMLLEIIDIEYHTDMDGHNLTVCKSCLSWMIELIDKGMINEIKKDAIAKETTSFVLSTMSRESIMRTLMKAGD